MKSTPKQPAPKGGQPLPPGAHNVPGSEAYRRMQGAPHPGEIFIGRSFLADSRGGPPLVIGRKVLRTEGDKPRDKR
jgi:hypothetical protein